MRMKTIQLRTSALLTMASLIVVPGLSFAQFGLPVLGPTVAEKGAMHVDSGVGLLHGSEMTDVAAFGRFRYDIDDITSIHNHIGTVFGDLVEGDKDAIVLGFGGKVQFFEETSSLPLDAAAYGNFQSMIGDADTFGAMFGGVFGHTFVLNDQTLSPYGGLGLGFTKLDRGTELSFVVTLGADYSMSERLEAFTEFGIGPTDGLPILNWYLGLSYRID